MTNFGRTAEKLVAQLDEDGVWHARFPTGLKTLCFLGADEATSMIDRPTCGRCRAAAVSMHEQVMSVPASWGKPWIAESAAIRSELFPLDVPAAV